MRVLVVDDMPLARQVLAGALGRDPDIEVVGVASDAHFARRKLEQLPVDVLTLDVEMPRVDGLSFLRGLLAARPMPVVMVSALTRRGGEVAMRALELGAVDVVAKPEAGLDQVGEAFAQELAQKVKAAARARLRPRAGALARAGGGASQGAAAGALPEGRVGVGTGGPVILLGASTGGCEAIHTVLAGMPEGGPPVVCVQHIPPVFSASFAERLGRIGPWRAREAQSGDVLQEGHVYVAPGGQHVVFGGAGARITLEVAAGARVSGHCPSVDVTFRSAAQRLGPRALAALLTGMGQDGAAGLGDIRDAGGLTLAEDESTCVVFGMPREAIRRGAAEVVAPLDQIASFLTREAQRRKAR